MEIKILLNDLLEGGQYKKALDVFIEYINKKCNSNNNDYNLIVSRNGNNEIGNTNYYIDLNKNTLKNLKGYKNQLIELEKEINNHQQKVLYLSERKGMLQGMIKESIDDYNEENPKASEKSQEKVVLFVSANPLEESMLQVDTEYREISNAIQKNEYNNLKLLSKRIVTSIDLYEAIIGHNPNIIHFSGHGASSKAVVGNNRDIYLDSFNSGGIILQDSKGLPMVVPTDILADLFENIYQRPNSKIEIVILNACFQEEQAKAIAKFIPFVIGTNDAFSDKAAILFATSFYQGLSAHNGDVNRAFDFAKIVLRLEFPGQSSIPVIYSKKKLKK